MAVLAGLDVDMVNLHAAGTRAMMEAALEGVTRPDGSRPLVIAVTQLTSTSQERMQEELLIQAPIDDGDALRRQRRQRRADGVVYSPHGGGEGPWGLRRALPDRHPGIRFCRRVGTRGPGPG